MLSLDVETYLIQPGLLAPPIVCVSSFDGHQARLERGEAVAARFEAALAGADYLVGQNIAYDFGCYLAAHPEAFERVWAKYAKGEVFDIGIAATVNACAEGRMSDERGLVSRTGVPIGRYSLEELVKEWLGRSDAKRNDEYRLRYGELDDVPTEQWPESARQYPIDDATNTYAVAQAQIEGNCKNLHTVPFQSHVAFCLHLGSMWGIRTDGASVKAFTKEVLKKQLELKLELETHGLYRWKGTKKEPKRDGLSLNKKAVQARVTAAYGAGNEPKTDKGGISTDRVTLEESADDVLLQLAQVSKLDKQASYIPALREAAQVPLNVRPNVFLSTGRASYEGIIQLIPRKGGLRNCFVARPGHVLISVDYSAIEMSTLAQVCIYAGLESRLAEAINADKDPHCILGSKLCNRDYASFLKDAVELSLPEFAGLRQAGKAANFGFPGLMGPATFTSAKRREGESVCEWFYRDGACTKQPRIRAWRGRELDRAICERCCLKADELRHFYAYETWVEMPEYWQWVKANMSDEGSMVQFCSKILRGGMSMSAACNNLFQGLAAFGAKKAVLKLTEEMYLDTQSPLYGSRLLIFAHDETILEVPEEKMHEAGFRQAEVMIEQMRTVVPDVKVKAEPAAMRRWDKGVKTVLKEGKLQVWEPKKAV